MHKRTHTYTYTYARSGKLVALTVTLLAFCSPSVLEPSAADVARTATV